MLGMRRGLRNTSSAAIANARRLRTGQSLSEDRLWFFLRAKRFGWKFRRQVPVGPYTLDFYCPAARLCVEVDGEQHALRRERDEARDAFLAAEGIATFRFASLALFDGPEDDLERVLREIAALCRERSGREPFETE